MSLIFSSLPVPLQLKELKFYYTAVESQVLSIASIYALNWLCWHQGGSSSVKSSVDFASFRIRTSDLFDYDSYQEGNPRASLATLLDQKRRCPVTLVTRHSSRSFQRRELYHLMGLAWSFQINLDKYPWLRTRPVSFALVLWASHTHLQNFGQPLSPSLLFETCLFGLKLFSLLQSLELDCDRHRHKQAHELSRRL